MLDVRVLADGLDTQNEVLESEFLALTACLDEEDRNNVMEQFDIDLSTNTYITQCNVNIWDMGDQDGMDYVDSLAMWKTLYFLVGRLRSQNIQ